jgi:hypothetical protein
MADLLAPILPDYAASIPLEILDHVLSLGGPAMAEMSGTSEINTGCGSHGVPLSA